MKKKGSTMASAVATAFALGVGIIVPCAVGSSHASAETNDGECYYINSNQVSMTKYEYDLLHNIGFDDYEVENMTESKFDKLMGMGFITTQKDVKIVCSSDDDNSISNNSVFNNGGASLQSHITDSTPSRRFETYGDSKVMYTYVSFAKNKLGHQIFVKQNVIWQNAPSNIQRFTDVIAIDYTKEHIMIADNGHGFPDAEMRIGYRCFENGESDYINIKYDGFNRSEYNYEPGNISFSAQLPRDDDDKEYWGISVSLEVVFDTNVSTLIGTEIRSYYGHQTIKFSGHEKGRLRFTLDFPYIYYEFDNDGIIKIDKVFEDVLFRSISITLDDEWLLPRC